MAERRNEVMDMVAQEVSWAKAGGTNKFVRLPMSLIRPRACVPREPNEDTTKVQILIREPGGGLLLARSIHVVQQLLELDGGIEPIWLMSQHRRGLPGQRS